MSGKKAKAAITIKFKPAATANQPSKNQYIPPYRLRKTASHLMQAEINRSPSANPVTKAMTSSSDPENTPDDSISVHSSIPGVPAFTVQSYQTKQSKYCILIPIINEGERIHHELERATNAKIPSFGDIIICDGGSTDGSTEEHLLLSIRCQHASCQNRPRQAGSSVAHGTLVGSATRLRRVHYH